MVEGVGESFEVLVEASVDEFSSQLDPKFAIIIEVVAT